MSKRILVGGLVAVGLLAVSAGTASAQFVTPFGQPGPFGGSYGAVYPTPSGGIVQQQGYFNPYSGASYSNKTYSNPFTGVVLNRRAFSTGGFPNVFAPSIPTYRNYGLGYPGYRFGYGNPGVGNRNFVRPRIGYGFR